LDQYPQHCYNDIRFNCNKFKRCNCNKKCKQGEGK
jgi:hypothetical protein